MKKLTVVVDPQVDFMHPTEGVLGTEEALQIVEPMADYINECDGDVAATMDTHDENYLNTQEGKRLPVVHTIKNTKGWKIMTSIYNALMKKNAVIFEKGTFGSLALAQYVAENEYDVVVLIGVDTDICVISNAVAIKLFSPETRIIIKKDLCAGATKERHEIALKAMEALQMDIE